MRLSEAHGSWVLFAAAGAFVAIAIAADFTLPDEAGALARASAQIDLPSTPASYTQRITSVGRASRTRPTSPVGGPRRIAYLEFHCDEPVQLQLSDGTRYPPRYEAVIPVRAGFEYGELGGRGGRSRRGVFLEPGQTAQLPCPSPAP